MKYVYKPLAFIATSALVVGGMAVTATAANAEDATREPVAQSTLDVANIAKPVDGAGESAVYNDWHFDPTYKEFFGNVADRRNGIFIGGASNVLIAKGNGNDGATTISERADKKPLGEVLGSLAINASSNDSITYQVPVRWDANGDGQWEKDVDGWSTLRKAPGDANWLTSQPIATKEGVAIAKGASADAASFEALGVYPIATGFLSYGSVDGVLVSSFSDYTGETRFGAPGGASDAWSGAESVHAAEIAGEETDETYASWHIGNEQAGGVTDVEGEGQNEILGLALTGKTQLLRGLADADFAPNLASAAGTMQISVVDGEAWAQVAVFSYQPGLIEPQFTTLRAPVPASGNLADAAEWTTSWAVGDLAKNGTYPLAEILEQLGDHDVIGYGVFADTGKTATVASISFNGKTTSFTRAADVDETNAVLSVDGIKKPADATEESSDYNDWHFDPSYKAFTDNVKDARNGVLVGEGSRTLIVKGNGNDTATSLKRLPDPTKLSAVLAKLDANVSSDASVTLQVPVRWDKNGNGTWEKGDGWSTLRKAPGDTKWTTSKAVDANGVVVTEGGQAEAADFERAGVYAIASGVLVYDNAEPVLISSITTHKGTQSFGVLGGTAEAWSGSETVHSAEIAGTENDATYASWHLGDGKPSNVVSVDGEGRNEVLGLAIQGKTQVLRGLAEDEFLPNAAALAAALKINVTEGEAWAQIPVFSYQPGKVKPVFTTLRAQVPASGNLADATVWVSSKSVGGVNANESTTLDAILTAIGDHDVIGYGVFVDAAQSATVESISFNGKATSFTKAADAAVSLPRLGLDKIETPADGTESSAVYNQWHFDPDHKGQREDRRNGIFVAEGGSALLVKGNGNDKAVKISERVDKTSLAKVLKRLEVQASSDADITLQVPVRWDSNGDGEWKQGDGWSTLRKAPGASQWTTSKAIDVNGVKIAANAEADVTEFAKAGLYPIATGVLVYKASAGVLVTSVTTHEGTQVFGTPGDVAAAWTGSETVHAARIAGEETDETYASWHIGNTQAGGVTDAKGKGLNEIVGLEITGKTQLLRGLADADFAANIAGMTEGYEIKLASGEAWAQIPVFSYQPGAAKPVFTTLRAQVPASGKLADATVWVSSKSVGGVNANENTTLDAILTAIGDHDVIGYGVFVDTGQTATVKSISFNGKTTSFTKAADAVNPPKGDRPTVANPPKLVDVPKGAKFHKEISWLASTGITKGVKQANGSYKYQPASKVSRSAMAAFLFRLHGDPKYVAPKVSPFADVKPGDKYYKEITWLHANKISTGTKQAKGKPKFGPSTAVSRQAMAAFMYRADKSPKKPAPKVSPFADVKPTDPFYKEIVWMAENKISTGTKQAKGKPKFDPKSATSRQAMAAFLYRADRLK